MSLRKGLQADSEDELLQMQAEFQASGKAPAAKVAGVRSRNAAGPPTHPVVEAKAPPQMEPSEGVPDVPPEDETSEGWQIVGDVCERQPGSSPAPQMPVAVSSIAFPKATHRRVSKFVLSRRAKGIAAKPGASSTETAAPSLPEHQVKEPPTMRGTSPPMDSAHSTSRGTASVPSQDSAPAAGSGGPSDRDVESQMAKEIAAENQKLIASMQPDQVEKARQEIRERLDPSILAFLEKRAAQRKAQQAASKEVSAGTQHDGSAKSQQPQGESGTGGYDSDASKLKMSAEQQGLLQGSLQASVEDSISQGESVVARTCFNTDGQLAAVRDAKAAAVPVTERDILRQDEGALGSGYTVQEMCQLARSALPAQRAFACRLLAVILARTQEGLRSDPTSKVADMPQIEEVTWQDMWRHLICDCEVALVLRLALDDANSGVIAAAAAGLHALLDSRGSASQDDIPDPELPAVLARRLERPHPSAAWMSLYPAQESEDLSFPQNAAEAALGAGSGADPRELAKHDTLAALLQMQVLDRINYLLNSAAAPAAIQPLLAVLSNLALGGADVAHAICDTPALVAGLMAILDLRSAAAASSQAGGTEQAARPAVLRVMCLLCSGGTLIARRLLAEGLENRVLHFAVEPALQTGKDQSEEQTPLQLQVIALRIWRILTAMGLSSIPVEEAYPAVCRHLEPHLDRQMVPGPTAQEHADLEASIGAEALGLFWTAFQHDAALSQGGSVSEECRVAVRKAAAMWLQEPTLEAMRQSLSQSPLNRHACALFRGFSAALGIVALDKDVCTQTASTLASTASDGASVHSPGLFGCMLQVLTASTEQQNGAHACLAVSAALRASLKMLKGTYPQQATDLAMGTMEALAKGASSGNRSMQCEMQPGLVMHLEETQSWAATLLTAIEVLQSLSWDSSQCGAAVFMALRARVPQRALLWMLTALPPGAEDLALRALSCLLSNHYTSRLRSITEHWLTPFLTGGSTLAEAALRQTAWWQEEAEKEEPAQLPSAEDLRETLLHAYARHWLGLVPEGPPSAASINLPPLPSSLFRQPIGSRLPLPDDWVCHVGWEGNAVKEDVQSELPSISEEGAGSAAKLSSAAGCLLFVVHVELGTSGMVSTLPLGTRLSWLLDLLFGAAPESPTPASSRPWMDPLIRQTAAALLHWYLTILTGCRPVLTDRRRSLAAMKEADAARWAMEFATVSYGDPLLASAVAMLLLPQMPPGVQVTVLDVLDQEGALHLLPSMQKAPSVANHADGKGLYSKTKPPAEVLRIYRRLLEEGSLTKAAELGSLPYGMATKWA